MNAVILVIEMRISITNITQSNNAYDINIAYLFLRPLEFWIIYSTRLIRDGEEEGKGVWRWGEREIIHLSLHCHHQNDSYIKMGSDESHFNVSLIVRDKVTRRYPQTTTFEEKGKPKRIRTEVLLLTSLTPYR